MQRFSRVPTGAAGAGPYPTRNAPASHGAATEGGFQHFRRATETPFKLVFEARA
jgi:hypothetical protein